ncbi:hypothetical protein [Paraburkholderia sp. BL17N1]|uniref:hypothetical protein n=1 Tax=Paraburkholderia sp. BL17N1 TaxID=1938798 RepID=UPI000EB0119B|nr:hypothetical protein [Paraburkholderia sp. BL17N1]RKR44580.1 hypothetical protein B0G82_2192 [Paraburkholderia sp. BL17N1]
MNTYEHEQAIRAEREHSVVRDALAVVAAKVASIENRLAEKAAARDQLVTDVRTGAIDEAVAAMRLACIDADVRDLTALIGEAKPRAVAAAAKVDETARALRFAHEAVAALERREMEQALDAAVRQCEQKLLVALRQRYVASRRTDRRIFSFWQASVALREAINGNLPNL